MSQVANLKTTRPLSFIIIGAGFGGVGMAITLQKKGEESFVILERSRDVGGVWRDNSYPGAACDVPSHLYSFSFAPNPNWSHVFAPQKEIYAYLQDTAHKYDLLRHIRFGAEVKEARYNEGANLWEVTLTDGSTLAATHLVAATGQLSRPAYPKLKGKEEFEGHVFHSAQWDHDYDLTGKRVAGVGTGASAIQFVPAIAGKIAELKVFQRSPAYIIPRADRPYTDGEKARFKHAPLAMKFHRAMIYLRYEARALAFTRFKGLMKIAIGVPFRRLLNKHVPDAALRAKLIPDYPMGCKRMLLSSEYLATMSRPNVDLITAGISHVTKHGIVTNDGSLHEVDAIIYGTGFKATEFLAPMRIVGRDGVELNQAWKGGAKAYLGMTIPNFPNFFMLYGPNTNLGHNSIVYMLESQIAHIMRCLKAKKDKGATRIEVDAQRYDDYNTGVQQRLKTTVWNGCRSWYVDANGHNSTNWPGFTVSYRAITKYGALAAYRFSGGSDAGRSGDTVTPLQEAA
jgi:cation diffusion facilitator CzcD-associated flavoprotein CzcO